MSRPVYSLWVFGVIALAIALGAFGLAQLHHGAGMIFVAAATTLWAIVVASKARGEVRR